MDLEERIGGVRTWLDDWTTPLATALLYIPPLLAQYQPTEHVPDNVKYGLVGLLVWNLIRHVRSYRHIAQTVKEQGWNRELFRGYVNQKNGLRYARHSPERLKAYERFRSENFRVRGQT